MALRPMVTVRVILAAGATLWIPSCLSIGDTEQDKSDAAVSGSGGGLGDGSWISGGTSGDSATTGGAGGAPAGGGAGATGGTSTGGTSTGGTSTGGTGSAGGAGCTSGEKTCSGVCVSVSDPGYGCGATSCTPCALPHATATCASGGCAINQCIGTYEDCNGNDGDGCEINVGTSSSNCGTCGKACATGTSCVSGVCQCSSGQTLCGTTCVNTQSDANNCGGCGSVCTNCKVCTNGTCSVPLCSGKLCPSCACVCSTCQCPI